jgi:hypothetical protein
MSPAAALRFRSSMAAVCLLGAAALVPFSTITQAGATDTSCWTQAQTPQVYIHSTTDHQAEASAYVHCGAYLTLKLVTSTGAVLLSQDFNAWQNTLLYTFPVACPAGTVVHSWVTSRSNTSFKWTGGVTTSDSVTC